MKLKRSLILVIAIALIVALSIVILVACGGKDDSNSNDNPQPVARELPYGEELVESIRIKADTLPEVFHIDDQLDLEDTILEIVMKEEGTVNEMPLYEDMITGFTTQQEGEYLLTVSYGAIQCTFKYMVLPSNVYTIRYILNGGQRSIFAEAGDTTTDTTEYFTIISSDAGQVFGKYNTNAGLTSLLAVDRNNYTFGGWYSDEEFASEVITSISPLTERNYTFYAKWTPTQYTVTFVNVISTSFAESATALTESFEIGYNVEKAPIEFTAEDTRWASAFQSVASEYNTAFYSLVGVFNDQNTTQKVDLFATDKGGNVTQYILWTDSLKAELDRETFVAPTYPMGGDVSRVVAEEKIRLVALCNNQVLYSGLVLTASDIVDFNTSTVGEKTLTINYKHFDGLTYSIQMAYSVVGATNTAIRYNTNGGTFYSNPSTALLPLDHYDYTVGLDSDDLFAVIPTKTAYTFAGWYVVASATATPTAKDTLLVPIEVTEPQPETSTLVINPVETNQGTLYLLAKWEPTIYTIHYMDGTAENNELFTQEFTVESTTTITEGKVSTTYQYIELWTEATRTDYYFMGWYASAERSEEDEYVTTQATGVFGDQYYYADWEPKVTSVAVTPFTYDVLADKDDGKAISSTIVPLNALYTDVIYLLVNPDGLGQVNVLPNDGKVANGGVENPSEVELTTLTIGEYTIQNVIKGGILKAKSYSIINVVALALNNGDPADWVVSQPYEIVINVPYAKVLSLDSESEVLFVGESKKLSCYLDPVTSSSLVSYITFKAYYIDKNGDQTDCKNLITSTANQAEWEICFNQEGWEGGKIMIQATLSEADNSPLYVDSTNVGGKTIKSKYLTFILPEKITTGTELKNISLTGHYYLANDINLETCIAGMQDGQGNLTNSWQPIGYATRKEDGELNYANAFKGSLYGRGHKITGLRIDTDKIDYICAGLFGAVDSSEAVLDNVVIDKITIVGSDATNIDYLGGIAGVVCNSIVRKCVVTGSINFVGNISSSGGMYVGGLVGMRNGGMYDCATSLAPTLTPMATDLDITITIKNATAGGILYVGNILGYQADGILRDCTAKGDIVVNGYDANKAYTVYAGGIVGYAKDIINKCDASVNITIINESVTLATTNGIYVGGVAGGIAKNSSNLSSHDFSVNIIASGSVRVGGIAGDTQGTLTSPTVNGFILNTDYVTYLDSKTSTDKTIAMVTGKNTIFAGGLAGNGNSVIDGAVSGFEYIMALTADGYVGGAVGSGSDIAVTDVVAYIQIDSISNVTYVGGIVGKSTGTVKGSFSTYIKDVGNPPESGISVLSAGTVAGYIGGIVGDGNTVISATSTTTIKVTGTSGKQADFYVGGIAGRVVTIDASSFTGTLKVDGSKAIYVGGIAGTATTITDSISNLTIQAVGNKTASTYLAGIVGYLSGKVTSSISTLAISGDIKTNSACYVGGIAGTSKGTSSTKVIISDCTVTTTGEGIDVNSLYDSEDATRTGAGTISVGGIAGNLSFTNVDNCNVSAKIKANVSGSDKATTGSVYAGGIIGQMDAYSTLTKAYTRYTNNITDRITASAVKEMYVGGIVGYNLGKIDYSYSYGIAVAPNYSVNTLVGYVGGFVGKNDGIITESYCANKIDVTVSYLTTGYIGGFAGANVGTISQAFVGAFTLNNGDELFLGADKVKVSGTSSAKDIFVGGFVGGNLVSTVKTFGKINNCFTNASTYASAYVGGFVGNNVTDGKIGASATITNCMALGLVNGGNDPTGSGTSVNGFAGVGLVGYSGCINYCYDNIVNKTLGGTENTKLAQGESELAGIECFATIDLMDCHFISLLNYDYNVWARTSDNESLVALVMDYNIWERDANGIYKFVVAPAK